MIKKENYFNSNFAFTHCRLWHYDKHSFETCAQKYCEGHTSNHSACHNVLYGSICIYYVFSLFIQVFAFISLPSVCYMKWFVMLNSCNRKSMTLNMFPSHTAQDSINCWYTGWFPHIKELASYLNNTKNIKHTSMNLSNYLLKDIY